jgi:hypothetical protein
MFSLRHLVVDIVLFGIIYVKAAQGGGRNALCRFVRNNGRLVDWSV